MKDLNRAFNHFKILFSDERYHSLLIDLIEGYTTLCIKESLKTANQNLSIQNHGVSDVDYGIEDKQNIVIL